MSPHVSFGPIALLLCCLAGAGCKGLPFSNPSKTGESLAPDFGLNSVPRQWEPTLEDGDTSSRDSERPVTAFDNVEDEDLRGITKPKSTPQEKNLLQKYLTTRDKKAQRRELPESKAQKKAPIDDDFGP